MKTISQAVKVTLTSSIIKDGGSITNMADYDLIFDEIYGYIAILKSWFAPPAQYSCMGMINKQGNRIMARQSLRFDGAAFDSVYAVEPFLLISSTLVASWFFAADEGKLATRS